MYLRLNIFTKMVKARKSHICGKYKSLIGKGENYSIIAFELNTHLGRIKLCKNCNFGDLTLSSFGGYNGSSK